MAGRFSGRPGRVGMVASTPESVAPASDGGGSGSTAPLPGTDPGAIDTAAGAGTGEWGRGVPAAGSGVRSTSAGRSAGTARPPVSATASGAAAGSVPATG